MGIETSFPTLYTGLVKTGIITLEKLIELMCDNPRKRFNLGGQIKKGEKADLTVFDLSREYTVDPKEFLSMGKATPFEGMKVFGKCMLTIYGDKTVWQDDEIQE